MKKLILCCTMAFIVQSIYAQTKSRDVFPNGGGSIETDFAAVSFTIGQSVTQTLESEALVLTQGFQQEDSKKSVGIIDLIENGEFQIYPNPTTGTFTVKLTAAASFTGNLEVVNNLGQRVDYRSLENSNNPQINFDYSNLNDGIYFIHFISSEGRLFFREKLLITK